MNATVLKCSIDGSKSDVIDCNKLKENPVLEFANYFQNLNSFRNPYKPNKSYNSNPFSTGTHYDNPEQVELGRIF